MSEDRWLSVADAPGAAIGSTRRRLREDDVRPVFEYLDHLDIGYWFIIGGNDSADTGHTLHLKARDIGYDLTVVNVPKTIDNDLALTDHCPGFGSAARFVSMAVMGSGLDAEAMRGASPITIFEVMGRDAGWLAASAALAKREERDAPHLICVPEVPIDEVAFVSKIEDAYTRHGFALAVVSENARSVEGVLGAGTEPMFIDDFGHEYHDGPARYLAALVSRHLRVRARYEKPGTIQRSFIGALSEADAREAELVGRAAVIAAQDGLRDVMITLERQDGPEYRCTTGTAPLGDVAGKVRRMPPDFLSPDGWSVSQTFLDYASPLVGPLPHHDRLL